MELNTAIITGASSGIGAATAKELAKKNIKVMLAARRDERLKELKQEIEDMGGTAEYKATDVTSAEEMEALAKETNDTFGSVDILVNNAGLMPLSFMNKRKLDEWNKMVDVNIKGVLHGIYAVLPYMEEKNKGHIINTSSVAAHKIMPGSAVYSGTKMAVHGISEGLRGELANTNIRTTIISPGMVATELTETITDEDILNAFKNNSNDMQPLQSQDIAEAVGYAIDQPVHVDVNEVVVRPSNQSL
ncbi:SDR family NAD(P)-dependent oxidoreductase [Pontibacillus yanchengensis]|uniref:Oxidoreductase n=3 Tax=Pontibacillus yanchengensis TaxID=462910 RepID=A0A0A2TAM7_9BACI|nr:SDR family oxidoreductase [Pontibacillus yanchengensis]KGP71141.1 oxidoreductase [Pontibacillus yanchengensis Y32]MYL35157.1 SDR family NAD(P)-dependent oxidoreductase [Pontibacillus yanchengensis]MYL52476.1 SDR family NAD(P)-dependent oxidoreductase [Pontibacillus yanchengensis]